jgi:hypothetical protein
MAIMQTINARTTLTPIDSRAANPMKSGKHLGRSNSNRQERRRNILKVIFFAVSGSLLILCWSIPGFIKLISERHNNNTKPRRSELIHTYRTIGHLKASEQTDQVEHRRVRVPMVRKKPREKISTEGLRRGADSIFPTERSLTKKQVKDGVNPLRAPVSEDQPHAWA